jgi:RecA/RadA recombinase
VSPAGEKLRKRLQKPSVPAVAAPSPEEGAAVEAKPPKPAKTKKLLPYTPVDPVWSKQRAMLQKKLGSDRVMSGLEIEERQIGLPVPFCWEYLLGVNILPLGRGYEIAGRFGSSKSALAVEIGSWVLQNRGNFGIAEVENKDAVLQRRALLKQNDEWLERLDYGYANTIQAWQELCTEYLDTAEKLIGRESEYAEHGAAWAFPYAIIVDSFMGATSADELKKIDADGSASKNFLAMGAAQLVSRYAKTLADKMRDRPVVLVGTNHLLESPPTQPGAPPTRYTPGGRMLEYLVTGRFYMQRVKRLPERADGSGGDVLGISQGKNSSGPGTRKIQVTKLWNYRDGEDGDRQQYMYFDWHAANLDVLVNARKAHGAGVWNQIVELLDLNISEKGRRIHSKVLDVPKSDPVSFTEAGRLLQYRQDLLDGLRRIFNIQKCKIFRPGVGFAQQFDEAYRTLDPEDRRYEIVDLSEISEIVSYCDEQAATTPDEDEEADE